MIWSREEKKRTDEHDRRLVEAEKESKELSERAERVSEQLRERLRYNHWGETIAAIARREFR